MRHSKALYALCFAKALNAALQVHIFPFVAAFILSFGVDQKDVAAYASTAESMMALTTFIATPLWVRIIERTRRRPIIIWSLLASSVIALIFGLSTRAWHLVVLRALLGASECLSFIVNIMVGELVDGEDKPQAFAWVGGANFAGVAIGLYLGGTLAEVQIPGIPLLQRRQYLLPGAVMGVMAFLGLIAVIVLVPETHNSPASGTESDDTLPLVTEDQAASLPITYKDLFRNHSFRHLISMNFLNKMCFFGSLAMISTAGHLPPSIGGIGLSVPVLGRTMAITQILTVITLLIVFKRLFAAVSNRTVVILGATGWVVLGLFFPLANIVSRGVQEGKIGRWLLLLVLGMWVFGRPMGLLWWTASQVLLNALFPASRERTKATGVLDQSAALASVIGVLISGQLFTFSSRHDPRPFTRQLAFLYIILLAVCSLLLAIRQKQITQRTNRVCSEGYHIGSDGAVALPVDEDTPLLHSSD